ncbi:MAG: hypothetical protein DWQ31_11175 [Planctomycetota bacterium]|nr:MAG: hypothetical protein DWQ31_11175 [Planctomycetota bacterium]REK22026.1 MAG: hypothetical protein DWQ42_17950 [Planctomycetota bacterium]REK44434.1 MAG: hypothetical protein DWQ46_09235 [Planctomycetota bacterium]
MAREDSQLESALVYALLFTAFAMFVLAMMAPRYERRQTEIENEFRGIQEMQRRAGGAEASPVPREPNRAGDRGAPQISLRPLWLLLGLIMVVTWAALVWRRARRTMRAREEAGTGST